MPPQHCFAKLGAELNFLHPGLHYPQALSSSVAVAKAAAQAAASQASQATAGLTDDLSGTLGDLQARVAGHAMTDTQVALELAEASAAAATAVEGFGQAQVQ